MAFGGLLAASDRRYRIAAKKRREEEIAPAEYVITDSRVVVRATKA